MDLNHGRKLVVSFYKWAMNNAGGVSFSCLLSWKNFVVTKTNMSDGLRDRETKQQKN